MKSACGRSSKAGAVAAPWRPRHSDTVAVEPAAERAPLAVFSGRMYEADDQAKPPRGRERHSLNDRKRLPGSARSVDVEHGLAADAALEESIERSGKLAP
jgi:hypothetical protein